MRTVHLAMCILVAAAARGAGGGPAVTVDINTGLSQVSPELYGQCIEHKGRCIYGGIWAEMLEDRKFLRPVAGGSPEGTAALPSPWTRAGDAAQASVGMDTRQPYVGRWSVELCVNPGEESWAAISHGELGLEEGREYTGYVVAARETQEPVALTARLRWGDGEDAAAAVDIVLTDAWARHSFAFVAGGATASGRLELGIRRGAARIGCASLMPADHVHGFRADTLAVLRALGATVYRWPGGVFAGVYDWREAIGERDRRSPAENAAWPGIEHHDVGIDEFMTFCRLVGAEPFVVVNTGLGTPDMAAALVQYANGAAGTPWGSKRAANGRPKPYAVTWWGIGHEAIGDAPREAAPPAQVTERHRAFARAMRAADGDIGIVAAGAGGPWSERMLRDCHEDMALLGEHFYCPGDADDVPRHVRHMRDAVRDKAHRHLEVCEKVFGAARARVPLVLTAWNYDWADRPHEHGDYGIRYRWRDGLGVAAGLCELIAWREVFAMATWARAVNAAGAVTTTAAHAAAETTALPLMLFRQQFGEVGVTHAGDPAPLEVACGITPDRSVFTLAVVNPTPSWHSLRVDIKGAAVSGRGTQFLIAHPDAEAFNRPMPPAGDLPPEMPSVRIETPAWMGIDLGAVPASPFSVTLWRLDLGPARAPRPLTAQLRAPEAGARLFAFHSNGPRVYARVRGASGGWSGGEAPVCTLQGEGEIDGLSACAGPAGVVLVLSRGGSLYTAVSVDGAVFTDLRPLAIPGVDAGGASEPCLVYSPREKRYTLFFTHRPAGGAARIDVSTAEDLAAFDAPRVALARGNDLGGAAVLPGARNVLCFFDARLGTCRLALAGRLDGEYVVASPPLGAAGTSRPALVWDGARAVLSLARREGGRQTLVSEDLRNWTDTPAAEVGFPAGDARCTSFVWFAESAR